MGKANITKEGKRGTIRTRLIIVPLLIVFIAISGIGLISTYLMRESLLNEMEESGFFISERIINSLETNSKSLEIINNMLDDKIIATGKTVLRAGDELSNKMLKDLAKESDIEQISWYNPSGEIVYSNIDEYIGWTTGKDHVIYNFITGNDSELIEDIRVDTETGIYFKYGYLKAKDGTFVQVGIVADRVQELTESISHQKLLEDISINEEIAYALFIDTNLEVTAHSNKEEIGTIFDDEGSKSAAIEGVAYSQDWYYEEEDIKVLDISYPAVINGEHIGAVSIGYSMNSVNMTNNRFDGIAEAIEEMRGAIQQVNYYSGEMAHKEEEIAQIMGNLSAISEENAAGTQEASASVEEQTAGLEEIANSSEELARIAEELNKQIEQFKI